MAKMAELASWRDAPNLRKECRDICGWAHSEIEALRVRAERAEADNNRLRTVILTAQKQIEDGNAIQKGPSAHGTLCGALR